MTLHVICGRGASTLPGLRDDRPVGHALGWIGSPLVESPRMAVIDMAPTLGVEGFGCTMAVGCQMANGDTSVEVHFGLRAGSSHTREPNAEDQPLRFRVASLVATLLLIPLLACAPKESGQPILLITVDTLRADHVGLYGYSRPTTPRIDRYFGDGRIFLRAYSTAAYTPASVVSILSGLRPPEHGVRRFYQKLPSSTLLICDLLPDTWQTAAFVSNVVLTDEALGIARCFDEYDDYVDEREGPHRKIHERRASRTTDAAIRWLRESWSPDRSIFMWVHYVDPHGPYRAPPDADVDFEHEGRALFDPARMPFYSRAGVSDGLEYIDRYDEEIAYTDREIGRLLDEWDELVGSGGLVALTSDHGETMMNREVWFDHGYHVWEEMILVPLLMRGEGIEPGRIETLVSLVDILPTLLGRAEVEAPAGLHGVDLLAGDVDPERIAYSEAHEWVTAIRGQRKWMVRVTPRGILLNKTARVYDLATDPQEEAGTRWRNEDPGAHWLREHADTLRRAGVDEVEMGFERHTPKVSPRVTPQQIEKLRGLGYIE
jgi:arylsulfatase A-like enzyme